MLRPSAGVFAGLGAGASGFVLKDILPADLVAAIRTVHAGDAVIAPTITRRLLEVSAHRFPDAIAPAKADHDVLAALTDREREVFAEGAAGLISP